MNINLLGLPITNLKNNEVNELLVDFLNSNKPHQIATINPEFLVDAEKNEEFYYTLTQCDLNVPDGIGLIYAARLFGEKIYRYTGVDLFLKLCEIAKKNNKGVYLLGGEKGSVFSVANKLNQIFPGLKICGADEGMSRSEWKNNFKENNQKIIQRIKSSKAEILFVAFGHPKQDIWISRNLKLLPNIRVAVGVGGTFDFISGKAKRAPFIFRRIGLEWLWRLILEPWRWKRIYKAIIKFPAMALRWKFIRPYLYRPNVACMLYKKFEQSIKILIVKRRGEDHWQIPQGGTDGQDIETAGLRELHEELSITKIGKRFTFKNQFKYKFNDTNNSTKIKRISGYRGQKQGLLIAECLGDDQNIKINYWDHDQWRWVGINEFIDALHPIRKESGLVFLKKIKSLIEANKID